MHQRHHFLSKTVRRPGSVVLLALLLASVGCDEDTENEQSQSSLSIDAAFPSTDGAHQSRDEGQDHSMDSGRQSDAGEYPDAVIFRDMGTTPEDMTTETMDASIPDMSLSGDAAPPSADLSVMDAMPEGCETLGCPEINNGRNECRESVHSAM